MPFAVEWGRVGINGRNADQYDAVSNHSNRFGNPDLRNGVACSGRQNESGCFRRGGEELD